MHWEKAIQTLDLPERRQVDVATLKLIIAIITEVPQAVCGFWSVWSNALYQLCLLEALLALPPHIFSFHGLPGKQVITVDEVTDSDTTLVNSLDSTWNSFELFELLVCLGDIGSEEVRLQAKAVLDKGRKLNEELVDRALLHVSILRTNVNGRLASAASK